jgi:hypothetical protein
LATDGKQGPSIYGRLALNLDGASGRFHFRNREPFDSIGFNDTETHQLSKNPTMAVVLATVVKPLLLLFNADGLQYLSRDLAAGPRAKRILNFVHTNNHYSGTMSNTTRGRQSSRNELRLFFAQLDAPARRSLWR